MSGQFLKNCNVESESISVNFHVITLKSTALSWTLTESIIHAWFSNIMHWSFWKYWFMTYTGLPNIDPFRNALQNPFHFYQHRSHQKSRDEKTGKLSSWRCIVGNKHVPRSDRLTSFSFCENVCQIPTSAQLGFIFPSSIKESSFLGKTG